MVHPSADTNGVHAVTAGGRRLKVLQKLAAEGAIPAGFKVPCLVEEPETARETSLIENTIRSAMHPADEFVAMASLIDTGEVVAINAEVVLASDSSKHMINLISQYIRNNGAATVSQLRQELGCSRRVIVPLLEQLDHDGVTLRNGDTRTLRAK